MLIVAIFLTYQGKKRRKKAVGIQHKQLYKYKLQILGTDQLDWA